MTATARAIVAVMGDVKRLKKDDRNKHGGYDFTSVDDFKDAIRPIMAQHGLFIHVSQSAFQMIEYLDGKGAKKSVAQYDLEITLKHNEGEAEPPECMTVALPFTGAQTSGAARSYAVKEWMKSRFLVSSGDEQDEADLMEQSREGLRLSKAEARDLYEELQKEIKGVIDGQDYEALGEWWQENKFRTETLPKDWFIHFRTEYAAAYKELKASAELDKMTNAQLDEMATKNGEARQ